MKHKDTHLRQVNQNIKPKTPNGCEECLQIHSDWVHLRLCLTCGHVGCCDSSPNKHATKHFKTTEHPINQLPVLFNNYMLLLMLKRLLEIMHTGKKKVHNQLK
jgi:uncharacterized UBP type Zn finger protein